MPLQLSTTQLLKSFYAQVQANCVELETVGLEGKTMEGGLMDMSNSAVLAEVERILEMIRRTESDLASKPALMELFLIGAQLYYHMGSMTHFYHSLLHIEHTFIPAIKGTSSMLRFCEQMVHPS